ncbi:hypothetical protein ABFS82_14G203400 [Erythranthe guttata]
MFELRALNAWRMKEDSEMGMGTLLHKSYLPNSLLISYWFNIFDSNLQMPRYMQPFGLYIYFQIYVYIVSKKKKTLNCIHMFQYTESVMNDAICTQLVLFGFCRTYTC